MGVSNSKDTSAGTQAQRSYMSCINDFTHVMLELFIR